jgi:glucose 1-dehydrogenase
MADQLLGGVVELSCPLPLSGRVALVTGAARGIGRGVSEALAKAGADVALTDLAEDSDLASAVEAVRATGRRSLGLRSDAGDRSAVEAAVARAADALGPVDILVCNAARFEFAPFLELTDEAFWEVLRVDLAGPFYAGQAVSRRLLEAGIAGRIIMVSSVSAHIAQRRQAHYGAAKAGLEMMAKTMAVELAMHRITVNCVAPGGPILTAETVAASRRPDFEATVKRRVPVGRAGKPSDVAAAVLYLASPEAEFVTGAVIVVDGGLILARD